VTDLRDRVLDDDGLAQFAVLTYGAPIACDGSRTVEFSGTWFGSVRLTFAGGATLEVATSPPESSVVTLGVPSGFGDEARVREALVDNTADQGLAIDWSAPEISSSGPEEIHTFWDPDPGLNASASLIYSDGILVAVRTGMAL
jgi:hypothetical protein